MNILEGLRRDFMLVHALLKEAEEQKDVERVEKFMVKWQALRRRLLAADARYNNSKRTETAESVEFFKALKTCSLPTHKNTRGHADRHYYGGFHE